MLCGIFSVFTLWVQMPLRSILPSIFSESINVIPVMHGARCKRLTRLPLNHWPWNKIWNRYDITNTQAIVPQTCGFSFCFSVPLLQRSLFFTTRWSCVTMHSPQPRNQLSLLLSSHITGGYMPSHPKPSCSRTLWSQFVPPSLLSLPLNSYNHQCHTATTDNINSNKFLTETIR